MRKHVRAEIARQTGGMLRQGPPDQVVGTSKTFRQLARIAGAAPSGEGPYVKRVLLHADVSALAERLPKISQAERLRLPGVSASRVAQLPAGAIIADAILDLLGVDQLELCPWALREGVILRRLDMLAQGLGPLPELRRQAYLSLPGMMRTPSAVSSASMTVERAWECFSWGGAVGDWPGWG